MNTNMNELNLSNRDFSIVTKNPGKTPYELKELGLSNSGFNKLMEQSTTAVKPVIDTTLSDDDSLPKTTPDASNSENTVAAPQEAQIPPVQTDTLIPKVTEITGSATVDPRTVSAQKNSTVVLPGQVLVKTPAGSEVPMGKEFAIRLVQGDNRYSIIQ